jgi:hypothetical protein
MHLFPNSPVRPKHHYLLHYPWLILQSGPLIHVWTMRMESKHSFFKRSIRSTHNFINVTKNLTETHQLNQAFLSSGLLLCDGATLGNDSIAFDGYLFSRPVVEAVEKCTALLTPIQCSKAVSFKGTQYIKDMYVVLHVVDTGPVFGKILLCLADSDGNCGVVISVVRCRKSPMLGVLVVMDSEEPNYECLLIRELWDYYPLQDYVINGSTHIALKHALFDSAEDRSELGHAHFEA